MATLIDFATAPLEGFEADGTENSVFCHTRLRTCTNCHHYGTHRPAFQAKNGPRICEPSAIDSVAVWTFSRAKFAEALKSPVCGMMSVSGYFINQPINVTHHVFPNTN